MKAVATFLTALNFFSACHGWTCKAAPQQFPASQLDAGQGEVVMTDNNSNVFYLSGSTWFQLGTVALKHVSVGPAGIWGVDLSDTVYKFVAGDFLPVPGLDLKQLDAGGDGQIVGVNSANTIHCLKSNVASTYEKVGAVSWDNVPGSLMYFSCGPLGCWGVNSFFQIYFTKVTPSTCNISGWKLISGAANMVEVGADGSVFVVNANGMIYQRTGISNSMPEGNDWVQIPFCLSIKHVSYDLGRLWLVTEDGLILQCDQ
ncbi:fish-egg lectin-like [Kryptolebias marmoratus]|uniref:Fish-egg lectin-like n=1 Tax=Kryptolebias marmoratus TaxID=37003 RepID=A0A3Q3BDG6_KRYMA|nr:fish-egg lectin-like [Kryptolebias marmoratus]